MAKIREPEQTVSQWCETCECERACTVLTEFTISCRTCESIIYMSAQNSRLLREALLREDK